MNNLNEIAASESTDPIKVSKTATLGKKVLAKTESNDLVTTFPNLVIKELIAFEILVIVLSLTSLLFNAPLEWIANPDHTPSPAKAPWYFLGLQELLFYFPPVVAGVILPALAVIALIVMPYFKSNSLQQPVWDFLTQKRSIIFSSIVVVLTVVLLYFKAYPILYPTLAMFFLMVITRYLSDGRKFSKWIKARSLSWWIMTWFVIIVVVLTAIGTFFRGPEWSWTWPWEGLY